MPAEAATESWKPRTPTSIGSTSTNAVTASASSRSPEAGRPSVHAVTARAAMTVARRTDGSKRVSRAKNASNPMVAAHRDRGPRRRSAGSATTNTKATFSPDTTSRCVSPAPRKSSAMTTLWSRASPNTNPVKSARRSGPRLAAPRTRARRTALALWARRSPGPAAVTSSASTRPTRWRRAAQSSPGARGLTEPRTSTRSPAARPASTPAERPRAQTSTRWRPARTSAWTAPPRRCGSPTRVPRASNRPAGRGRSPAHERAPRADASRPTPTISTSGRRATTATTTTAASGHTGNGTDRQAPSAATAAMRTAPPSPR